MDLNPQREAAFLRHVGRTILLVEDSRMFSTAIRFRLEAELGARVDHCANMGSLRTVLARGGEVFALAIVDLNLPGAQDGEALDHVLSLGIPTLVFTGSFSDRTRDRVLAKGVLDYIVKDNPAAIQQIVVGVDRILASGGAKVLVVESGLPATMSAAALVRRQRFELVTAADGETALELLDTERDIDIVVLDLDCPRTNGLALLSEIRRRKTDMEVRVVGLSGQVDDMAGPRFLRAGGDEFLRRPFCAEEFTCRMFRLVSLHKRLQALNLLASRDYLTGVYNRRYFFEAGKRLVDHAIRRGTRASIAILDIDHFKRLNDTYGHEVGDIVLKAVSRRLRERVGDNHLLARLGGEEFGVLFEGLDLTAAADCCEGLRAELASVPIEADGEPVTITVSAGLAAIEGQEAFENHLNAADQYLYMAKHAGRNRVFSELSLPTALAG